MHNDKLDEIDLQILKIMQEKARIKRKDLAEMVHLTIPAVSERLRKMQEEGYIKGFAAIIDPKKVELDVTAFIFITADTSAYYKSIIDHAIEYPEILECHAITGGGSHLLKVRTINMDSLEKLLTRIQSWEGVNNTKTNLVLSSPKETTELDLSQLYKKEKNKKTVTM